MASDEATQTRLEQDGPRTDGGAGGGVVGGGG